MEVFVAVIDSPRLNIVGVGDSESGSPDLSTVYAWRDAVLSGRLSEAAALRRHMESFEDLPSAADAGWQ